MRAPASPAIWLATGVRTPFLRVDGPFAGRDSLALSVPVVQAMARQATGDTDFAVRGSVALNLAYSDLARRIPSDLRRPRGRLDGRRRDMMARPRSGPTRREAGLS